MGWFKDRWAVLEEAAGVRKYVLGVIITAIVSALDWLEEPARGILSRWLGLKAEDGTVDMVFGFPSWIVGLAVAFALLWWWTLEYAVLLRQKFKPKINCSFGMDIPGCYRPNTNMHFELPDGTRKSIKANWYRIRVEISGDFYAPKCVGRITAIEYNNNTNFNGENLILPFAPSERVTSEEQDIRDKIPEYLDFLCITDQNVIAISTKNFTLPSSHNWDNFFDNYGIYTFHIVVACVTSMSESIIVNLERDYPLATSKRRAI